MNIQTVRRSLGPVLMVAVLATLAGCGKEQQPVAPLEVKVVEVIQKDVPVYKEWVGQTFGVADIEIRARVPGWLEGLHFKEGAKVRQGDLLYTIDQTELRQQVAQAQAKVAQASTLMTRAQADVNRYEPLAAAGAVSQRELEIAVAELNARRDEVTAATASLNLAETEMGYATIRAPISGTIGLSAARVGDFVGQPPNPIILNTISNMDSVRVRFSLSESEYLELARRLSDPSRDQVAPSKAELELILADGSVYPEKGRALFAERRIDPATGTLLIEASFPNPNGVIRPGQFARVRAIFDQRKNAVVVPVRALSEIQGQFVLFVVDVQNKVQFRRVVTGPKSGQVQVIDRGVAMGDKVIVEGFQRVRPDMVVTPQLVPYPADSAAAPGTAEKGR
jgi:membrane fusion protein, multidrug efflux system